MEENTHINPALQSKSALAILSQRLQFKSDTSHFFFQIILISNIVWKASSDLGGGNPIKKFFKRKKGNFAQEVQIKEAGNGEKR